LSEARGSLGSQLNCTREDKRGKRREKDKAREFGMLADYCLSPLNLSGSLNEISRFPFDRANDSQYSEMIEK